MFNPLASVIQCAVCCSDLDLRLYMDNYDEPVATSIDDTFDAGKNPNRQKWYDCKFNNTKFDTHLSRVHFKFAKKKTFMHSFICPFIYSFIHLLIYSFIHLFILSFFSFIQNLNCLDLLGAPTPFRMHTQHTATRVLHPNGLQVQGRTLDVSGSMSQHLFVQTKETDLFSQSNKSRCLSYHGFTTALCRLNQKT